LVGSGFIYFGIAGPVGLVGLVGNELTVTVRFFWMATEVLLCSMQFKLCTMAMALEMLFIGLRLQIDLRVFHHNLELVKWPSKVELNYYCFGD
tara:strand:- start:1652 stop:1930 length:279 start_codon:yes stop_codon:yes gene_type:complete